MFIGYGLIDIWWNACIARLIMKNYCIWLALKAGDHEHTEAYENLQLIRFFFLKFNRDVRQPT